MPHRDDSDADQQYRAPTKELPRWRIHSVTIHLKCLVVYLLKHRPPGSVVSIGAAVCPAKTARHEGRAAQADLSGNHGWR